MAKVLMIQGTTSNAGKSLVTAGLCRIFRQDGYRVAPFKSQNMALNSFITADGLEMGRAQVLQAQAAGVEPSVLMNPILLKPTNDVGSQVIVNGEVLGNMKAADYFRYKKKLIPDIMKAFHTLASQNDMIVIEGAGSPAEINLQQDDIVNMGMAKLAQAPVLLVGDIDRGGVFASLYGTVALLEQDERRMVKGLLINKFRGDEEILRPGLSMLEELTGIPVSGVIPYLHLDLDDEDSLSERLDGHKGQGLCDIAVVRFPRISNFTDFNALERVPEVSLRYITSLRDFGTPDMVILPGTKNTMGDLKWMRENGLEARILKFAAQGGPVFGICGGYQMMGGQLEDPEQVESGGSMRGMGLFPAQTVFSREKIRGQVRGIFSKVRGIFAALSGKAFSGYEIHMGKTSFLQPVFPLSDLGGAQKENCYGSYVHGLFDSPEIAATMLKALLKAKGIDASPETFDETAYRERQFDLLADGIRGHVDMERIYQILEEGI